MTYKNALKKAQEPGYAEADPTGDVECLDALGKERPASPYLLI